MTRIRVYFTKLSVRTALQQNGKSGQTAINWNAVSNPCKLHKKYCLSFYYYLRTTIIEVIQLYPSFYYSGDDVDVVVISEHALVN